MTTIAIQNLLCRHRLQVTIVTWLLFSFASESLVGSPPFQSTADGRDDTLLLDKTDVGNTDAILVQGLRDRRLYSLAVKHAQEVLQTPKSTTTKIDIQIEYLKTVLAAAFEEEPSSRQKQIETARAMGKQWSREVDAHPRGILLDVQVALIALEYGQLLRREMEVAAISGDRRQVAFQFLRLSDRELEDCDRQLEQMIRDSRRQNASQNSTTTAELPLPRLLSIQNNVRFLAVRTQLNRGLIYGIPQKPNSDATKSTENDTSSDEANRLAVLGSARRKLERLIPLLENRSDTYWQARLELLRCFRYTGELQAGRKILSTFDINQAPERFQLLFRAELIRNLLKTENFAAAKSQLQLGRKIGNLTIPDLDLSILEFYLSQYDRATDSQRSALQSQLLGIVRQIETDHGVYWGRRANLMLLSRGATGYQSAEILIRRARESFRNKEFSDAIADFEAASKAAVESGEREKGLELAFQAILIHRDLRQHDQVVRKSNALATENQTLSRSPIVHLAGVLSMAQLTRSEPKRVTEYRKFLNQHLELWPDHPSSVQVRIYLADLLLNQQDPFSAYETLRPAVTTWLVNSRSPLIQNRDLLKQKLESRLALTFEAIADLQPRKLSQFVDKVKRELWTAEVRKSFPIAAARFALALSWQSRMMALDNLSGPQKNVGPMFLRLRLLATNPDRFQAAVEQDRLSKNEMRSLMDGLANDFRRAAKSNKRSIARCLIRIAGKSSTKDHHRLLADCYLAVGDVANAMNSLATMIDANPSSLTLQSELARLQVGHGNKEQLQAALETWRKIGASVTQGSEAWFESRYYIASCHRKLGESKRALQMLKLLSISRPWDKSKHEEQLDALFKELSRKIR